MAVRDVVPAPERLVLDGMGERVAQVELPAFAGLERVARDDGGLHAGGGERELLELGRGAAFGQPAHRAAVVVVFVLDDKGLQQLRRPGQEIAARQRAQRIGAHEREDRLDDHAQHVLIVVEIHPRLAAYGRIDLGEQGGRDIGIPHAALVDGRGEPREVGRNPAADREHQRLPGRPRLQQRTLDEQDRVHGLVLFGRLEGDAPPHAGHGLDHLGRHLRRVRIVNDEHFRLFRHQRGDLPQPFAADHPAGRLPIDGNDILLLHKITKILEKFGNSPFLRYICNPSLPETIPARMAELVDALDSKSSVP